MNKKLKDVWFYQPQSKRFYSMHTKLDKETYDILQNLSKYNDLELVRIVESGIYLMKEKIEEAKKIKSI